MSVMNPSTREEMFAKMKARQIAHRAKRPGRDGIDSTKLTPKWPAMSGRMQGMTAPMNWNRSEALALAAEHCARCHGSGLNLGVRTISPCGCVLRSIFRVCYKRFLTCVTQERHLSTVKTEPGLGRKRPGTWGRKDEEFIADFCLVAKRILNEEEHRLFRYHFLLGADWKLCCRKLGLERGNFFHAVYRVEQKLGRTFRELRPYPLFPLDEYFNGTSTYDQKSRTAQS
jgi:hypothetical protein